MYRILQDDDEVREANVNTMASIYSRAVLVLVAAAEKNANTPLPGVQQTRPSRTGQLPFGRLMLTVRLPNIGELMQLSAWSTRGWTYQEAVLARRRLILTPLQAVFDCAESVVHEDNGLNSEPWSLSGHRLLQ